VGGGNLVNTFDLARWQFGITTVYHFLFVPLTIGLAFVVAGLETAWMRTRDPTYLRLTKFVGNLFVINLAVGVVTGIVQEFQFGMNWSDYSRFVGDVFGAPLAMEGLLAFFLESTFVGLWIFGWDRLSPRLHLATIWIAAFGSLVSAFFILTANAWMQHPVGFSYNRATHRAELTDFGAVLTNSTVVVAFLHTVTAAFLTTGALVAGIASWQLWHRRDSAAAPAFRRAAKAGMWMAVVAGLAVTASGHSQGVIMTTQQPMKMAAAEALYHTEQLRRSRCSPSAPWMDRRRSGASGCLGCSPSWLPALSTAGWKASTTWRRSIARGSGRATTGLSFRLSTGRTVS
jgi:cytochrome d ubiquinol oxidase subunit I